MATDTQPSAKTIRNVTFFLCVRRPWRNIAVRVEVSRGIEVSRIFAVDLRVTVQVPDVRDANCTLRDEHAFIPIVFDRSMGGSQQDRRDATAGPL